MGAETRAGSSPRVRGKLVIDHAGNIVRRLIPARAGKTRTRSASLSSRPAHPRACGENALARSTPPRAAGSSPRVRGKPPGLPPRAPQRGLIPARAGKTTYPCESSSAIPAHPRACGENSRFPFTPAQLAGSSPRVRGKRHGVQGAVDGDGLIPARAGKTRPSGRPSWSAPAHPRACGENCPSRWTPTRLAGSSPRVRGKRGGGVGVADEVGLIPARAGKTSFPFLSAHRPWAHPRACGENGITLVFALVHRGSSPRVRGKRRVRDVPPRSRGLIPARAGKTSPNPARTPPRQAHPRACGENMTVLESAPSALGSSPRVRGKPLGRLPPPVADRLIPARAGKTLQSGARISDQTAHPRACGENRLQAVSAEALDGSSPRVRGKPITEWESARIRGLIPARAGKTARS